MDYKPNSNRFREEQRAASQGDTEKKRTEKIVNGKVRTKKKSEISKLADVFVPGDVANVKSYVFMDVIVPGIKKAVYDIVVNGLDMIMYGEVRNHDRRSSSKVSYSRFYDDRDRRRSDDAPRARTRFDFEDIVFDSRGAAESVREEMLNVIDEYGFVTVADMYDMAGLDQPYTSNKYGWTSIRSAESVRLRDGGYILKLPRPIHLD